MRNDETHNVSVFSCRSEQKKDGPLAHEQQNKSFCRRLKKSQGYTVFNSSIMLGKNINQNTKFVV